MYFCANAVVFVGYPCAEEGCNFQGKTWTEYQAHRKAQHRSKIHLCTRLLAHGSYKSKPVSHHQKFPNLAFQRFCSVTVVPRLSTKLGSWSSTSWRSTWAYVVCSSVPKWAVTKPTPPTSVCKTTFYPSMRANGHSSVPVLAVVKPLPWRYI